MNKERKRLKNVKKYVLECLYKYRIYVIKYQCSVWFTVTLFDIIKNASKTENKDVIKDIINILDTTPYNKKIEKEILNSFRHE